ncbi:Gfo/Idh/MocA family oxidoreductase [bacterium]|nr:Gfo/Idh/MocA family oxidoreductase [bacterium]
MLELKSSRRSFVKKSGLGAVGATALSLGLARTARSANDEVVLGIIGCGGRGSSLLKRITNIPGIRIAAVCDLREDRRKQAAYICEKYNPTVYSDFRKLLDTEKLDGCIVATEVGNHAKVVVPVLESGIHCFSEKPMDANVQNVDAIVRAARKAKGIYQIGFQRRYAPTFVNGMPLVHNGDIGDLTFMQGHWHWEWSVGGWVSNVAMSGGELVEQACHHIDVMSWAAGEAPVRAMGIGHIKGPGRDLKFEHNSEDQSAVAFEFSNGAIFSYTHLFYLANHFRSEQLVVHGTKGGIDFHSGEMYPRGDDAKPVRFGEKVTSWEYGTSLELEAFANHIRNKEMPRSNVETGRLSTLTALMGRMAMYKAKTKKFEGSVVTWDELGTTTDKA